MISSGNCVIALCCQFTALVDPVPKWQCCDHPHLDTNKLLVGCIAQSEEQSKERNFTLYVPDNCTARHKNPLLYGPSNRTTGLGHCEVSCRVAIGHPAMPSSLHARRHFFVTRRHEEALAG